MQFFFSKLLYTINDSITHFVSSTITMTHDKGTIVCRLEMYIYVLLNYKQ